MTKKGACFKSESYEFQDPKTGALIRRITNHPSIHHHPFFTVPAYDDKMERLYFVSHRSGSAQIFAEVRSTGTLVQLTDREDLNEWSFHPSHDGKYVYYTFGTCAGRVNTATLEEEVLIDLNDAVFKDKGMVAAAMGTTALSRDDRWWAIKYICQGESHLVIIDTKTTKYETILRRDTISHLQFCPDDPNLLYYAGPLNDRVWVINRDGSNNRRLYKRNAAIKEWITHESWIPGTSELAFVDWPKGIRCINVDNGIERKIVSFNAWHAICSPDGTKMVADTNFPDTGLKLFDPRGYTPYPVTLCYPDSSSIGEHWKGEFPYENGPIEVYAPQHTHPHPSFSPDGQFVVYTSDSTGYSQIYEVRIPDSIL
jgi:oligogalacturonide lyase